MTAMRTKTLIETTDELIEALGQLSFGPPITHIYNPLEYARSNYDTYLKRFGKPGKEAVFLGMNPGPWGMAQTGVPFGEVGHVREWLGIDGPVGTPEAMHPKRPVMGFDCPRSEISGARVWGWAKDQFGTPEQFFSRFFIANYCPLQFMEESGRNLPPDKLKVAERQPLLDVCDQALRRTIEYLEPQRVIGIGRFAEGRAKAALGALDVEVGCILHPSPASPLANRGWAEQVSAQLEEMGMELSCNNQPLGFGSESQE